MNATNTRYQSQQALAAAMIRKDLKAKYPAIKFRVTSQGYSMGDNVNVSWTDGPTRDEVEDLICQYQYGKFNGMEDIYENTNSVEGLPQTKYLFCNRENSPERVAVAVDWLNRNTSVECYVDTHGHVEGTFSQDWQDFPSVIVHRMLSGYYARTNPSMDFSKAEVTA